MIYIREIKIRLFLILMLVTSLFLISYFYKETILFLIVKPNYSNLMNTNFFYFIFTNVIELFSVYLNLVLFVCYQFLVLYSIYHFFVFFSSALFFKEFIFLFFLLRFIFFIWIICINLLNFWLIPIFWDFFLSFQNVNSYSLNLHFEAKLSEYIDFYINIYYISFLYLQFFISIFLLIYNTIYSIELIKKLRKIFYFIFVIFSTLISPPDILSQILLSVLTIIIYEFLLFISLIRSCVKQVTN